MITTKIRHTDDSELSKESLIIKYHLQWLDNEIAREQAAARLWKLRGDISTSSACSITVSALQLARNNLDDFIIVAERN